MEKCTLCQSGTECTERIILTATKSIKYKLGPGFHSRYSDFHAHNFFVCSDCRRKRFMRVSVSIILLAVVLIAGDKVQRSSPWSIPLLVMLVSSVFILYTGRINAKLKKIAVKLRETDVKQSYGAFTLTQFEKLEEAPVLKSIPKDERS